MHDMQKYFEERMAQFEAELNKKSTNNTGTLADEFAVFKSFVLQSLKSFSQHIETLAREVDNMEMRSRRNMLLFHGIEEHKDEDPSKVVAETIKQRLKLNFTSADIKRCHRMGRQSSGDKPRPVVVKLKTSELRNSVWSSKAKLKGTGITVSEFLTRSRHNTFMAARERFGITKCWTRDGYVYVLSSDGSRHRISTLAELDKVKSAGTEKPVGKMGNVKSKRAAVTRK